MTRRRWYLISPLERSPWSRVAHELIHEVVVVTKCGKVSTYAEEERAKGKPRCKRCLRKRAAEKKGGG